ncbi:nucleotide-binding universal stress UspA family protein [Mycobacterium sp. BK086]|uniref:universal stress protein n=1 Tax=Mycobacterium sp. BK086 TaxID=2512165 RepID=UPI001060F527|nr:universal stress protein [Mycobacterium sp. BK086]TDO17354.1 nucleotide-binding universal stress UspA family protein [Mycobacterium sp. BK086]
MAWQEKDSRSIGAVVVGVDDSPWALNAVRWAASEAVNRDVVLRLVHVIPPAKPGRDARRCDTTVLDAADAARQARETVRVETACIAGSPEKVLDEESCHAEMVCIGARPLRLCAGRLIGATAAHLAAHARCPVAIIRSAEDGSPRTQGVVSVVLTDDADNDEVVGLAMREGRLRKATVRQIDRRLNSWIRRFPDVHVETVAAGTASMFPSDESDHVGLAVVGPSDAAGIASLDVPNCHPILGYPDCSVLLVRH